MSVPPSRRSRARPGASSSGCGWRRRRRRSSRASKRRRGDASDADRRVVREQLTYDLGDIPWTHVDAAGTPEQSLADTRQALTAAGITLAG